jgi:hypothetical protein
MTLEDMIAAVQSELGIQVDGKAGPETWGAVYRRIVPQPAARRGHGRRHFCNRCGRNA